MTKTSPARRRLSLNIACLAIGDRLAKPLATNSDRLSAYYWGRKYRFGIVCRKSVLGTGWEVIRVK